MRTSEQRQRFAVLWHSSAQITRADIFGPEDPLRPTYNLVGVQQQQVDTPALGMVGKRYSGGGVAILSVNPAGGSPKSTSTTEDAHLYRLFSVMRSSQQVEDFEAVNTKFRKCLPSWRIAHQYTTNILNALAISSEEICYLYLVPFRTAGDKGSTMPKRFTMNGYNLHSRAQLHALRPSLIIAMDRPSQEYANMWQESDAESAEVFYFTRKRDAHAERRQLLSKLVDYRGDV